MHEVIVWEVNERMIPMVNRRMMDLLGKRYKDAADGESARDVNLFMMQSVKSFRPFGEWA